MTVPMTELEQAEKSLADAKARAEGLAAMCSLELHAAAAAGPDPAARLVPYHQRLRQLNRTLMAAYLYVRDLRAAQGLPPLEGHYHEIPPDFGPLPIPAGSRIVTGRESTWLRLLGSLDGDDLPQIAECLADLEGWTPSGV